MGEQSVQGISKHKHSRKFIKSLIKDVLAFEKMLDDDLFENDISRIGAEQEMVLIDENTYKPRNIAVEIIDQIGETDWLDTELAQFNLEINLKPQVFTGTCFSDMESELRSRLNVIDAALKTKNAAAILTGILPTLRKFNLELENLTPRVRYRALMDALSSQLKASAFEMRLMGIDELLVKHKSPLLEAVNTSFQVHLQVAAGDFVAKHNIAQAVCAPVMAIAANSPIVFGRRLWHESRIAMFQQAIDTRSSHDHMREWSPRVNFGSSWLEDSVLEIFKDDISRFRVLIATEIEDDSLKLLQKGIIPKLKALQVHNSTVYRWNRPCYGISDNGKPHLRIENRVLPAGPTVTDEMANAAFWLGAVEGYSDHFKDITKYMSFEDVRDNFAKAAKFSIDSTLNWEKDKKVGVCDLILQEMIPIAKAGLEKHNVNSDEIDNLLGIIEERAKRHMNGARWGLRAFTKLKKETNRDEALTVYTSAILENQRKSIPVHEWELPRLEDLKEYRPSQLFVDEFMTTDIYTVEQEDPIDLVMKIMEWRDISHIPIEDESRNLVGLVSLKQLLKIRSDNKKGTILVKDVMLKKPITIGTEMDIKEAMIVMKKSGYGCLPVTQGNKLVGIVTEEDLLAISRRLLERL